MDEQRKWMEMGRINGGELGGGASAKCLNICDDDYRMKRMPIESKKRKSENEHHKGNAS